MPDAHIERDAGRAATVQQEWVAWLPEDKSLLFDSLVDELKISYNILSVVLNDAFAHCDQGELLPAREQAMVFAGLFDRLSGRLRGILRTLAEHGRHFGTHSRVAPLRVDLFRSELAQSVVRANNLLSLVSLRRPSRFFRKTAVLDELVGKLQEESREIVTEMKDENASCLPVQWERLEVLHYDLNTCCCETTIVLKSFFCALPGAELLPFRARLLALAPATSSIRAGRPDPIVANIVPDCAPQSAASPAPAAAVPKGSKPGRRRLHS